MSVERAGSGMIRARPPALVWLVGLLFGATGNRRRRCGRKCIAVLWRRRSFLLAVVCAVDVWFGRASARRHGGVFAIDDGQMAQSREGAVDSTPAQARGARWARLMAGLALPPSFVCESEEEIGLALRAKGKSKYALTWRMTPRERGPLSRSKSSTCRSGRRWAFGNAGSGLALGDWR
jgi:hypothetical protein